MHALVLADGDVPTRAALDAVWPGWADGVAFVVAADGGARHAAPLDLPLDRWVGDGDSIDPTDLDALRRAGVEVTAVPAAKDESDTELAVTAALTAGASRITVLGALGGARVDHALANVGLLSWPALDGCDVRIVAASSRLRVLVAPLADVTSAEVELHGRVGDLVSLFPVGSDVEGVTTDGLAYPLVDARLLAGRTRGLSNVRTAPVARVRIRRGRLLIAEAPASI